MNYKNLSIGVASILVSFLIFNMNVVLATDVNILFQGEVQESTEISAENVINSNIVVYREPSDRAWANVKVLVSLSSASLARSISKIYLYKCKNTNPVDCVKGEPLEFETYVDTELLWNDISEQVSTGLYPQAANILALVKLEGEGQDSWAGLWHRIERVKAREFNTYAYELSRLDIEAQSMDLVLPIKSFIETYQMVPFTWASKATFVGANIMYSVGANSAEMGTKTFQTAQPSVSFVDSIAKDYFFVFPNTTSGVTHGITLNKNPSFTCGNNLCEADLGETDQNCCYDCGCTEGFYCDMSDVQDPKTGACKRTDAITLDILPVSPPSLTDCTQPFDLEVRARILGAPSGLQDQVPGIITIDQIPYTSACTLVGNVYTCPITLNPAVGCGIGSYDLGPNNLTLSLNYHDGPNPVVRDVMRGFPTVQVNYDCGCPEGYYCDFGTKQCKTEASIALSILDVTSFITDYDETGDTIDLLVKINNPPGDLEVTGTTYSLGNITITGGPTIQGASGTITCDPGPDFTYTCNVPFKIDNYNHENQYVLRDNTLTFEVTFSSAGETKTKSLVTAFSDITIPSHRCGDGAHDPEETSENCCFDAGCPQPGLQFCDMEKGCLYYSDLQLEIETVSPTAMDSCRIPHDVFITGRILAMPTDVQIETSYFLKDGQVSGYAIDCAVSNRVTGHFNCTLTVPPIDCPTIDPVTIGPNELNLTLSYSSGPDFESRSVSTTLPELTVTPFYICGNGECEAVYGENADNCCLDCSCEASPSYGLGYYCDTAAKKCMQISNMSLVVTSPAPTTPKTFKSCEVNNKLSVIAYIKNAPDGAKAEAWNIKINGSNARHVSCKPMTGVFGGANQTYNCTVTVKSIWNCKQGNTYTWHPNEIQALVSFNNGPTKISRALNASLPTITVTQSIRTLHNIIGEFRDWMNTTISDLTTAVDELIIEIEECIEELETWFTVGLILMLVMTFATGTKGTYWSKMGERATAGAALMQTMVNVRAKMCEWKQKKLEWQIEKMKLMMGLQQMRVCIAIVQHNLDIGKCVGRESACFQQMVTCSNQGGNALSNAMSTMNNIVKDIKGMGDDIATDFTKLGKALGEAYESDGSTATIQIKVGSNIVTHNVCGHKAKTTGAGWWKAGNFEAADVNVVINAGCDNWKWTLDDVDQGKVTGNVGKATSIFLSNKEYTAKLFCGTRQVNTFKLCYCRGNTNEGCWKSDGSASAECAAAWKCSGAKPVGGGPTGLGTPGGPAETTPGAQPTQPVDVPSMEIKSVRAGGRIAIQDASNKWTVQPFTGNLEVFVSNSDIVNKPITEPDYNNISRCELYVVGTGDKKGWQNLIEGGQDADMGKFTIPGLKGKSGYDVNATKTIIKNIRFRYKCKDHQARELGNVDFYITVSPGATTTAAAPDVKIKSFTFTPTSGIKDGDELTYTLVIENEGSEVAPKGTLEFCLMESTASSCTGATAKDVFLTVTGGTKTAGKGIRPANDLPFIGTGKRVTLTGKIKADPSKLSTTKQYVIYNNNYNAKSSQVQFSIAQQKPNLKIEFVNTPAFFKPTYAKKDLDLTLKITDTKNVGRRIPEGAGIIKVRTTKSDPTSTQTRDCCYILSNKNWCECTWNIIYTYPPAATQMKTFTATVDPTNAIDETNNGDNDATAQIEWRKP